ncbi:MAG: hypothetical protein PHU77_12070, partial [Simplicispira sp.]|nr:hypothetical protein [Simplicispira sp.]
QEPSKPALAIATAGFLLSHAMSLGTMTYQQNVGIFVGTWRYQRRDTNKRASMALTDSFVSEGLGAP